jgi:hypothetical protein
VAKSFDRGKHRIYFSSNFLKNHVFVGSAGAKKRAEVVFQRRRKNISTVLCLIQAELVRLAAEISRRQEEFTSRPKGKFTTEDRYDLWSRGGKRSSDKQRAISTNSSFRYGVKKDSDNTYVMCHFDS